MENPPPKAPAEPRSISEVLWDTVSDPEKAIFEGTSSIYQGLGGSRAWGNRLGRDVVMLSRVLGGVGGASAPLSGARLIPKGVTASKVPAPATKELGRRAQTVSAEAGRTGVAVKGQTFGRMVDDVARTAKTNGIDPKLHPESFTVLKTLSSAVKRREAPGAMSRVTKIRPKAPNRAMAPDELLSLRRRLEAAADKATGEDREKAEAILRQLDGLVGRLETAGVSAGDAKRGVKSVREAWALQARARKSKILDNVFKKAKFDLNSPWGGQEAALRRGFDELVHSETFHAFSPAEQAAIRAVVEGGPVRKAVQFLSKFAPRDPATGAAHAGIAAVAGSSAGIGTALTTEAARRAATMVTMGKASSARDLVRRGASTDAPMSPVSRASGKNFSPRR